jgi:hypothetical protein
MRTRDKENRNPWSVHRALLLPLVASAAMAWGCAASVSSTGSTAPAPGKAGPAPVESAPGEGGKPQRLHWMKPPAPIEGQWKVLGCEQKLGMVVEFALEDPRSAGGRVVEPGGGAKYGYQAGEIVFEELVANDYGNWRGRYKWRNVTGVERWDPVYFTLDGETLKASMSTDPCLGKLERVP